MHVMVDLPFVDLRPFSSEGIAGRLVKPGWPDPIIDYEFVRRFGQVKLYPSGYSVPWQGERYYCDASRLLVFDRPLRHMSPDLRFHQLSRRLFTDGVVGRTEVSFRCASSRDVQVVAQQVADLKVRVGKLSAQPLIKVGGRMAAEYSAATLPVALRGDKAPALPRLVLPGHPMIVISRSADSSPSTSNSDMAGAGVDWAMEHEWSNVGESATALWTIVHRDSATKKDVELARRHAVRLHSEIEAFAAVLRACREGLVDVNGSERLRDYLYVRSKRLLRRQYDGWPQTEILRSIASRREMDREGELPSLQETFRSVKSGMMHMVKDASGLFESKDPQDIYPDLKILHRSSKKGIIVVNDNSIRLGAGASVNGVVGSNNTLTNSPIGAQQQDLESLVRLMLEQLHRVEPELTGSEIDFAEVVENQIGMHPVPTEKVRGHLNRILSGVKSIGEAGAPIVRTIGEIINMLP